MTPSSTFTTSTPGATSASSGATPASVATPATSYSSTAYDQTQNQNPIVVYLDGDHSPEVDRFINHNTGRLVLQSSGEKEVPLDDIAGCMEVCQNILRDNFPDGSLPAISENICALLGKLGGVAGVVGGSGSGSG